MIRLGKTSDDNHDLQTQIHDFREGLSAQINVRRKQFSFLGKVRVGERLALPVDAISASH